MCDASLLQIFNQKSSSQMLWKVKINQTHIRHQPDECQIVCFRHGDSSSICIRTSLWLHMTASIMIYRKNVLVTCYTVQQSVILRKIFYIYISTFANISDIKYCIKDSILFLKNYMKRNAVADMNYICDSKAGLGRIICLWIALFTSKTYESSVLYIPRIHHVSCHFWLRKAMYRPLITFIHLRWWQLI